MKVLKAKRSLKAAKGHGHGREAWIRLTLLAAITGTLNLKENAKATGGRWEQGEALGALSPQEENPPRRTPHLGTGTEEQQSSPPSRPKTEPGVAIAGNRGRPRGDNPNCTHVALTPGAGSWASGAEPPGQTCSTPSRPGLRRTLPQPPGRSRNHSGLCRLQTLPSVVPPPRSASRGIRAPDHCQPGVTKRSTGEGYLAHSAGLRGLLGLVVHLPWGLRLQRPEGIAPRSAQWKRSVNRLLPFRGPPPRPASLFLLLAA